MDVVTSVAQLRAITGMPSAGVQAKAQDHIDEHCRAFIAQSPMLMLATSDGAGRCDVSPRGDAPGFVKVLDAHRILIAERPGNRRMDTLRNIIENPQVGMLFIIPGKNETLRMNGRAVVARDEALRDQVTAQGKRPEFVIVADIDEAFFHCAKCMVRSALWRPESWPAETPDTNAAFVKHTRSSLSVAEMKQYLDNDIRDELY